MNLRELIRGANIISVEGPLNKEINNISYNSTKVKKGDIFVCLEGHCFDGHEYVQDAVKMGASVIVSQKNFDLQGVTLILTKDTREALAVMSSNFFGNPSSKLITIGITGTKGKTTTSCMIKSILDEAKIKTGLIGTLGVVIGNEIIQTENTTPESYEIQKYFRYMVDNGCRCAVVEASSIGLKAHRLDGFNFDYGIFTNFSEDHIGENEHKDMKEYLECKKKLFKKCRVGFVNIDDKNYSDIIKDHTCKIKTYGFSRESDIIIKNTELISKPGYVGCKFDTEGEINFGASIPIPGEFSAYNAVASVSVCSYMGIDKNIIKKGLNQVKVKGRVEVLDVPGGYTVLIDYAHNAVSMSNILSTLREYNPKRLITLFGAGGNRAKSRRCEVGEISGKLSDLSVITADNSRYENVMDIISDIETGIKKTNGKYVIIPDRKEAIKYCIENAKIGDIIVLAGKGHEIYQEINGVKYPFDERRIVADIINGV